MHSNKMRFLFMLSIPLVLFGCTSAAKMQAIQSDYENALRAFKNLPADAKKCAAREYARAEGRLAHVEEEMSENHWSYAKEYMPEADAAVRDASAAAKTNCPPKKAQVIPPPPPALPEEKPAFVLEGITFDFDKATIRPTSEPTLNEAGNVMKRFSAVKIRVEGHTDSLGPDAYNQKLSEKRAMAVKDYFVSRFGINASRIDTIGLGEGKPVADNKTEAGQAQNRRIEIWVTDQ